jgi:hypothetical protein
VAFLVLTLPTFLLAVAAFFTGDFLLADFLGDFFLEAMRNPLLKSLKTRHYT